MYTRDDYLRETDPRVKEIYEWLKICQCFADGSACLARYVADVAYLMELSKPVNNNEPEGVKS